MNEVSERRAFQEILRKVSEKWKRENLDIVPPYSKEQIQNSFDKIGKLVSRDIFQVYTTFGGLTDCQIDSNLLSFWSLEQLVAENSECKSEFTAFGDFLIYSHSYGYKYENENVSSVYSDLDGGEYIKISESVEEFFNLYLTDPMKIGLYEE